MKPQISGNGDLIVFINGGGCGQWMWQDVVTKLTAYRTLTFDYNGYAGETGVLTFTGEIEKVKEYIREYGSGRKVFLVGHSLGAQILLKIIQDGELPEVEKGIAISALNIPQTKWLKQILNLSKLVMPLTRRRWFARLNAKSFNLPERLFERYFEETKTLDFQWLCSMMQENMSFKVPRQDPGKVSVLVGEKEIKVMRESARTLSDAPLIIKGAGHDIPYNYPDAVVQEINRFFGSRPV